MYARWIELNGEQSAGLEIKNGVIVGIGSCTDQVLKIAMPVAEGAFIGCSSFHTVIFYNGASLADKAFGNSGTGCPNLRKVYFEVDTVPQMGRDVFGSTWNHSDFAVYVPAELYDEFESFNDSYWQQYLVNKGKLHVKE